VGSSSAKKRYSVTMTGSPGAMLSRSAITGEARSSRLLCSHRAVWPAALASEAKAAGRRGGAGSVTAEIDAISDELGEVDGPLVVFLVGTGLRPEEALGAEWRDIDLDAGVVTVRRAFAKGRLKDYPKTVRSRRRVPAADGYSRRCASSRIVAESCSRPRRAVASTSTTPPSSWTPALAAAGSRIVGSTTCVIRTRRGAWPRAWTSSRSRPDGHEPADDRPHLRPLGGGCG
jgi:hypothetical protein